MSKVKQFTAKVHSGVAGFLIEVKGEINCGMLDVQLQLTEREPQGINPTILQYTAYPAANATPEQFRNASQSKNLNSKDQYKQVEIFDPQGEFLERIQVSM